MKSLLLVLFLSTTTTNIMAQYFSKHKWNHRLIVLADCAPNFKNAFNNLMLLNEKQVELEERDILIYFYHNHIIYDTKGTRVGKEHIVSLPKDYNGYMLIGKDGGIKLKAPYPISTDTIFNLIDGMPMRRAEIKNKQ